MHELAVTRSMLGQVIAEAEKHGAARVTKISMLVGESAGVVPDCVRFYFETMKQGTPAEGAELEFKMVPLLLRCPKCGTEFSGIEDMCRCNAGAETISGQEMVIESIEVEDDDS